MIDIHITLRDGTKLVFPPERRAGGAFSKKTRYDGSWVVVTDEWGKETAYPSDLVFQVEVFPKNTPEQKKKHA